MIEKNKNLIKDMVYPIHGNCFQDGYIEEGTFYAKVIRIKDFDTRVEEFVKMNPSENVIYEGAVRVSHTFGIFPARIFTFGTHEPCVSFCVLGM